MLAAYNEIVCISRYRLSAKAHHGGLFGGPLKKKPGMQISVIGFDGECVLAAVGVYTKDDAALLQSTLDRMEQEISVYAAE